MISIKLQGGLGNQMFQIAACLSTAKKFKDDYCVPKNKYFPHLTKCNQGAVTAQIYTEPSFEYNEIPKPSSNNLLLQGYFQSGKYFLHCKKEVIKAFNFGKIEKWEGVCSIHYRAGDYKLKPTKHPIISKDYLLHSMQYMYWLGFRNFKIISDEPDLAISVISSLDIPKEVNWSHSVGNDEVQDLIMMARCEGNICANSSYSWWAHYLNPNEKKIGIFPKNWFGPDLNHNTKDLYPPNAIIL